MNTVYYRLPQSIIIINNLSDFIQQNIGCDRPINYKTENLRSVLKSEYPVSMNNYKTENLRSVLKSEYPVSMNNYKTENLHSVNFTTEKWLEKPVNMILFV